ncbi:MAG: hypothetical protein Ct9H300mP18_07650 [Candidatus Neomarinimicrobiota bacterium]|nr:MAG: hypothetical protein Ct9H300mP18_07650 [Candidatus Neomarinimicrobiota bacterium]
MAGHSKWANIKHKKAAQDAKKGKVFTKIIKELMVFSKIGGSDPESNPRLRQAFLRPRLLICQMILCLVQFKKVRVNLKA